MIVRGKCDYCEQYCGTEEDQKLGDRLIGYTPIPLVREFICEVCAYKINQGFSKLIASFLESEE